MFPMNSFHHSIITNYVISPPPPASWISRDGLVQYRHHPAGCIITIRPGPSLPLRQPRPLERAHKACEQRDTEHSLRDGEAGHWWYCCKLTEKISYWVRAVFLFIVVGLFKKKKFFLTRMLSHPDLYRICTMLFYHNFNLSLFFCFVMNQRIFII